LFLEFKYWHEIPKCYSRFSRFGPSWFWGCGTSQSSLTMACTERHERFELRVWATRMGKQLWLSNCKL